MALPRVSLKKRQELLIPPDPATGSHFEPHLGNGIEETWKDLRAHHTKPELTALPSYTGETYLSNLSTCLKLILIDTTAITGKLKGAIKILKV